MNRVRITALLAFGLLFQAPVANAWWQWYQQDLPYTLGPGWWFYQTAPQQWGPGAMNAPWLQYALPSQAPMSWWNSQTAGSGLNVQQSQSTAGYLVRIQSATQAKPTLGVDGQTLLIRSQGNAQSGWSAQWVSLPADANIAAMRVSRSPGLLELFIPRRR